MYSVSRERVALVVGLSLLVSSFVYACHSTYSPPTKETVFRVFSVEVHVSPRGLETHVMTFGQGWYTLNGEYELEEGGVYYMVYTKGVIGRRLVNVLQLERIQ